MKNAVNWSAARLIFCAFLGMFSVDPAMAGKRIALVIGITKYKSVPSLPNPARDAAKVAQALRSVNFEVTELTEPTRLSRTELLAAVTAFKRAAVGAEAAIIYYAGHGVQVGAKNWLLPSDVQAETPDEIEASAFASSYLINAVSGATAVRLVILDACRDNPFSNEPGWSGGGRSLSNDRGLIRETNLPPSVVVLLATQPGTKASDGGTAPNSPFALALASVIPTEGLRIGSLPSAVLRAMKQMSGIDQRPDMTGIFDEENWAFRSASAAVAATVPVAASLSPNADAQVAECDRLTKSFDDILPVLAVPACTRAVSAAPGLGKSLRGLGQANQKAENYPEAKRWFEQAAATGDADAMNSLGYLFATGRGVAKDYVAARRWFEQAATKGNSNAMFSLGIVYTEGWGVTQDYGAARRWHEQAASAGNSQAMNNLGVFYQNGLGVAQDFGAARRWYEQAEAKGEAAAMLGLGVLHHNGQGVAQDYGAARRWYEQAAAKGNALAMFGLGVLHNNGQGVAQDYAAARHWYEQAAAKGEPSAMTNLAFLYEKGQGVAKDDATARRWYEKAAGLGNEEAKRLLAKLPK